MIWLSDEFPKSISTCLGEGFNEFNGTWKTSSIIRLIQLIASDNSI